MKLKHLCIALILLLQSSLWSQDYVYTKLDSVAGKFNAFSVDNFGRITLVHQDVILALSNTLDTLFSSGIKSFRPSSVESSKSFRTLLFDQERSVVHFLDNTMTDIHGEIDLVNLDIQQPWLVCESFGGNTFWVFDAGSMRLIRLNEKLDRMLVTENLGIYFENDALPVRMMEAHDKLFMLVPGTGVLMFDVFGTYLTTVPTTAEYFDVFNGYLLTYSGREIQAVNLDPLVDESFVFPAPADLIAFKFTADRVYFLTKQGLYRGTYSK